MWIQGGRPEASEVVGSSGMEGILSGMKVAALAYKHLLAWRSHTRLVPLPGSLAGEKHCILFYVLFRMLC